MAAWSGLIEPLRYTRTLPIHVLPVNENPRLRGVIAAIPTPVTMSGEPDTLRFVTLARRLFDEGCDGLNVLGTTGEATSFSIDQRLTVMAFAASQLPLRRLLVGTGAAAVADAVRLSRQAAILGFSGALLLPPFYYKGVTESGLIDYVSAVIDATDDWALPVYLYNFPALTGVPYTSEIVRRLVARYGTRIAGLKDSSGDLAYSRAIASISCQLDVFPSSEGALLEARNGVFAGCISATANLNAWYCAKAYHEGDAAALSKAVAIRQVFDGLPLVPGIKLLLSQEYNDPVLARVLPPLSALSAEQQVELRKRSSALFAD